MCALFLAGAALTCALLLYVGDRLSIRALRRSPSLDEDSVAALLSLEFGTGGLYLSRWFPVRSPRGTLYEPVPFILVRGRNIFVITVHSVSGIIDNTDAEAWRVSISMQNGKKKTISVKNPVYAAEKQADVLRALFAKVGLPFPISVEPIAVITAKHHKLLHPSQAGLGVLPEAIAHIRESLPPKPSDKRRLKQIQTALRRDEEIILRVLRRYSLPRAKAIAKINALRQKKK